ncbi:MAG: right-handed parallel beta-helix repeat-containing protein [Planctomycetota bacterium]
MRLLSVLACLALLSGSLCAQGDVWIVDSAGAPGADFAQIADAVDAAADGDTILVRPHLGSFYDGFTVDDKSLVIASSVPGLRFATGQLAGGPTYTGVSVRHLDAGRSVVLRGGNFRVPSPGNPGLLVKNCTGEVWVEDCESCGNDRAALRVLDSDAVTVQRCVLNGCSTVGDDQSSLDEDHGLHAINSNVYMHDTIANGQRGDSAAQGFEFAVNGGDGARVEGGFLYVSGSTVHGGDGGPHFESATLCSLGGAGGNGLTVLEGAEVRHLDTWFEGGDGGFSYCHGLATAGGEEIEVLDGAAAALAGTARHMELTTPVSEGAPLSVTLRGEAGEHAFAVFSTGHQPLHLDVLSGPLLPAQPIVFLFLGIADEDGLVQIDTLAGELGAGTDVATLFLQSLFVHPAGSGPDFLGAGTTLTFVDRCKVLSTAADCNENGVADTCDIADGTSADCDSNGLPDECQSQADCNGNGVPDFCDIAAGTSLDADGDAVPDECEATLFVPDAYATLQAAVDAAVAGDQIVLRDGVYGGPGFLNVSLAGKNIIVRGENGAATCVLDALGTSGPIVRVDSGEGASTRLEGLTFRGLNTTDLQGALFIGHGAPVVTDCVFEDNRSWGGGGVYIFPALPWIGTVAKPVFRRCRFESNVATARGGALFADGGSTGSTLTLEDCTFVNNTAANTGGAMVADNIELTVERCVFSGNSVALSTGGGGALETDGAGLALLRNSLFHDNSSGWGGAIQLDGDGARVELCTISGNTAEQNGGAIALMTATAPVEVVSCILWNNASTVFPGDELFVNSGTLIELDYVDLQGGLSGVDGLGITTLGAGVLDVDPLFVNPAGGDYHLAAGSPCVDAGDPTFVAGAGETDLDGDARVLGAAVDLGSDERP